MHVWERTVANALHVFRIDSIRRKMIAFSLLATIVPALTMGWLAYTHHKEVLNAKTVEELDNAAAYIAQNTALWLRERQYDAKVFSSSYEVIENLEKSFRKETREQAGRRLRDYLQSVRAKFTDYEELLVMDPGGRVIASSSGKTNPPRLPADWLSRAKADSPIISEPYYDEDRRLGLMTIGVPVRATDGHLLGVLASKLNFTSVERLLKRPEIAQKGRISLLADDGHLIVSSAILPSGFMKAKLPTAALHRLRESKAASEYSDYQAEPVIGVLVRVPTLEWEALVEIQQQVAYAAMIQRTYFTLTIVFLLLLAIGLLAYILGLTIVRPLDRLAQGAARVAVGHLDVTVPVVARGEVGYLTEIFNDMVARLKRSRQELEALSITDHLTKLFNRKHMMERLTEEASRENRHHHPFSILMLDIDGFKKYNDTFGHLAGDQLLTKVAVIFQEAIRTVDFAARYGGEEFLIVLPETDLEGACEAAERIRERVANETAQPGQGLPAVTVSIGVATFPENGATPEALISSADAALYEAKRRGRNRVTAAARQPA